MFSRYGKIIIVILVVVVSSLIITWFTNRQPVDFTTHVKPIINQKCITCHGGVKQKAGFSLLFREEALAKTESGKQAIIPGDAANSELIKRLTLNDPEERMPYMHEPLSSQEIDIFRRWINEGAKWGDHWAYVPVKEVEVPQPKAFFNLVSKESEWAQNPIDNFIENKLDENNLKRSLSADRNTLLRRVSLDLIGVQPPDHLAQKFLEGSSEEDYTALVDSLLASPRYGEKWASMWMDLARYADTKGYEKDDGRDIWKYRDWLIKAFNDDKPYVRFLTEQIAGDLLPDATDAELIATAFHRNSMTNDEGGTDNEEFRTSAVIDRVNTTWDATMGTTFGCVQCHSHPYDPFKHAEYYKFYAFFNNSRDEDTQDDYPLLRHYNDTLQQELFKVVDWVEKDSSPEKAKELTTFLKTWQPTYNTAACDSFINSALGDPTWIIFRDNGVCRMKNVNLDNNENLIFRYSGFTDGGTWKIHLDKPDGPVIASAPLGKTGSGGWNWKIEQTDVKPASGVHDLYFTYTNPNLKKDQSGARIDWIYFTDPLPGSEKKGFREVENTFWKLLRANVPTTPVMIENPPYMRRASHVFERGNWMVKGDKVEPGVPGSLNPFPEDAPANRLGLAMWLTSKQNPLTARAMVNRVWEQLFGTGLAETLEDMGSQGIPPTHPELLDWLSYQFMNEYNWSLKKLIRTMVLSATYQQDSKIPDELLEKDPYNKFYARSSRVRLSAEQIRDQALCISGKLNEEMYGPSVYPYQPKGLWLSPYNGRDWITSKGDDQYRRAVYTYWKRSAPYPSMITFDGVARDVCTSRRVRTNTPLQALTILNDSAYIDLARHFAYRMQKEAGDEVKEQVSKGYQLATYHPIDDNSLAALMELYNISYNRFKDDGEKARKLLGGKSNGQDDAKTAALVVVANAMMNLDEVVTRN
ncbi:MAG: DUF1553 domain-containing protein [Cyclobacteriaceae bacterium]